MIAPPYRPLTEQEQIQRELRALILRADLLIERLTREVDTKELSPELLDLARCFKILGEQK